MGCWDSKSNISILEEEQKYKQEVAQKCQKSSLIKDSKSQKIILIINKDRMQQNKRAPQSNKFQSIKRGEGGNKNEEKHLKIEKAYQQQQIREASQCMICLDKPSNVKTKCNHLFCKECIQGAVKRYNFCPYCRAFDPLGQTIIERHNEKAPSQIQWNLEIARKVLFKDEGEDQMRRVYLQNMKNGAEESTNIFVSKNAKIQCSPSANIIINGQRVNPNQCNQQ